jgi:hypothetical protein
MKKKKPAAAGKTDRHTKEESTGKPVRNAKPGRDPKRRNPMAKAAKPKKAQKAAPKVAPSKRKVGRRAGAR